MTHSQKSNEVKGCRGYDALIQNQRWLYVALLIVWGTDIDYMRRNCRATQTWYSDQGKKLCLYMDVFGISTVAINIGCQKEGKIFGCLN